MKRMLPMMVGVSGASSLLLLDSAVKGTALLALAAIVAVMLRRDSAATRHLVWLLAMVALLVVPAGSAFLPQWRVLPEWASIPSEQAAVATSPGPIGGIADDAVEAPKNAAPVEVERPSIAAPQLAAQVPDPDFTLATAEISPEPASWSWTWSNALPLLWAAGFSLLILRLVAARLLLWNAERQATAVSSPGDPMVASLEAACSRLGIARPVTLLIHPDKTMPVVWGIRRCRLLLPCASRHWSGEQLRSVLLHELAHIKRRDTAAQLLTQIACALHWFNPLVWFAAWRLGVERERACDDLVLASGVRPSAYAGHLLEVATGLAPARWTQSCGLAMARKSSLEGRLVAVLSESLNRRGVSLALAGLALVMAVGIVVPVAMLRAQPAASAPQQEVLKPKEGVSPGPKDKQAQALFRMWQAQARSNGDIPGGLVSRLAEKVKEFIRNNTGDLSGDSHAKKMAPLVDRFDATGDWKPDKVVALMDDIAVVTSIPLETTMTELGERTLHTGKPLPKELANAPWGEALPDGLRLAWLLEPRAAEHRLGTPLRSRILIHNSGKDPVVFRTRTWHQSSAHRAQDGQGANIKVDSTDWTTLARLMAYRLAPGEFIELNAPGIGVGARNKDDEDWQNIRVGAWIDARVGDDVIFTADAVPLNDWNDDPRVLGESRWWLDFIAARLARETPLPADAAERTRLLDRAVRDLFGTPPTAEETAAFVADRKDDSLDSLARRLFHRTGVHAWAGPLTSASTKFRVLPVDPDAAKKPRVANNPGRYTLGDLIRLVVTRRPDGERIVNEARIQFFSQDLTKPPPGKSYELKLADGYGTWAAAWVRGETVLWLLQKGTVRSYDFSDPTQVKEMVVEEGKAPKAILDALRGAVEEPVPEESKK